MRRGIMVPVEVKRSCIYEEYGHFKARNYFYDARCTYKTDDGCLTMLSATHRTRDDAINGIRMFLPEGYVLFVRDHVPVAS